VRKLFFMPVFFHCAMILHGQYYITGSDPGNIKWCQINSPHYTLVFPKDFKQQAQRVAGIFEYSYSRVPITMNSSIPRIPILIHGRSAVSNGITSWAPRRIELFPIPYQDNMYCQNWYEQLALHEFRHISQFNNFNRGITRVGNVFFGQVATAVVSAIIPPYFFEGDAVMTETALSHSGRGRLPWFQMVTRAQLLEKKRIFSYRKVTLGSYRNYIPDHYQFGYLYVASIRDKYGYQVWDNTVKYVGRHPFVAYPGLRDGNSFLFSSYSRSLKKNTGMHRDALYKSSFAHLDTLWRKQDESVEKTQYNAINKRYNHVYTSYRYPALFREIKYETGKDKTMRFRTNLPSCLIAEKSGIDQITSFVKIDREGNEEVIHTPGLYIPENLSISWPLLAWIEYIPGIRWEHQSYSVVKTKNLETGKVSYLTRRTRYTYPVVSPDATQILVVDYTDGHQFELTVIDSKNGKVMVTHPVPDNIMPMNPCWDPDGRHVYAIINSDKGKNIQSLDVQTGEWRILYFPDYWEMYQLAADKDNVYFRSGFSGIENIYALRKSDLKVFQVTSSRFGAFDPLPVNDTLFYTDYSADGYNLVYAALDPNTWKSASSIIPNGVDLNSRASAEEGGAVNFSNISDTSFEIRKYSKLTHLFNFHSWMPFYNASIKIKPEPIQVVPGVTTSSQNLLGTAVTYGGIAYQNNYNNLMYFAGFNYTGFFPVFNFEGSYGGQQIVKRPPNITYNQPLLPAKNFIAKMYLPLNLSRGKYYCVLYPEIDLFYSNIEKYDYADKDFSKDITRIYYKIQFYQYLKRAYRDIVPRLGYGIEAALVNSPFDQKFYGNIYYGLGTFYLPGFGNHQSVKIEAGCEQQNQKQYITSGLLQPSRGYEYDISFYDLTHFHAMMKKITIDYVLPIVYPDISIFDIFYITRFRADLFYDYSEMTYKDANDNSKYLTLNSAGYDLTMDFHAFHSEVPFSITFRQAYLIGFDKYTWGIKYDINLLKF
jgi:hypothetical protein